MAHWAGAMQTAAADLLLELCLDFYRPDEIEALGKTAGLSHSSTDRKPK
jgi:hypothetical protein